MSFVAEAWARLGIAATDDKREVKRAYGRELRAIDPETDPQAFLDLREAYETALSWGTQTPFWEDEAFEADPAADSADSPDLPDFAEIEAFDDSQWERWRPEPPAPADEGGLGEACSELDRLLFAEPPPESTRLAEAATAVMVHPELANVDRLTETELWMAEAIAASSPRSDPLIEPAIARFGWNQSEHDWRRHYQISWVLGRRDDLLFLKQCHRGDHECCPAVEALTRPPPGKLPLTQLALAGSVGKFLVAVANRHPTLERDLDPDSLAWWRAYLHGRHLPPDFVTWMLAGPVVFTYLAGFVITSQGWSNWLIPAAYGLGVLAVLGGLLGKAELEARARRRLAAGWGDEAQPSGVIERLVLAALLLPPLAALLPNGSLWTGLSLTASLALAAAGLRRGWVEPGWGESERARLFLPVVAAVVAGTILAPAPIAEAMKLVPPLCALCWLGSRIHSPMQLRAQAWPAGTGLKVLATSLLCIVLAAAVIARAALGGSAPLWALLLIPSAIVGGHLAAAGSPVDVHRLEWPLRIVALITYFATGHLGEDRFWLRLTAATAVYALLYVGCLTAGSIRLAIVRSKQERRDGDGGP